MESWAAIMGHPLHAMLIVFPLGLFTTAFLFDLIHQWKKDPFWRRAAFWLVVVGEVGTLGAVPMGLADYFLIPMPERVRNVASIHLYLGLGLLVLFALQIWIRHRLPERPMGIGGYPAWFLGLSAVSVAALLGQGAIGGHLAHVERVGVQPAAAAPVAADRPPEGERSAEGSAELDRGRRLFAQHCAPCHGENAGGDRGPKLRGSFLPAEEVARKVKSGGLLMPSFSRKLTAEEIAAVAAHVGSLAQRP